MTLSKKKNITIVTSNRADYGILKNLIVELNKSKIINSKLIVFGAHTLKQYGKSIKEIKADKIRIYKTINSFTKNYNSKRIPEVFSSTLLKFNHFFKKEKTDILVVLGDRFEIFSVTIAATLNSIPIAHIHGGELTEGAIDDAIRHAISKLSHLHFTSNIFAKKLLLQMGENPKLIFNVGSLGVERIKKLKLLKKNHLEKIIKTQISNNSILLCFHPVTLELGKNKKYVGEIINVLKKMRDYKFFISLANPDQENEIINNRLINYAKNKKNIFIFRSLGSIKFLSLMKYVGVFLTNSSSGIIESPSLRTPTINLGERQKNRIKAKSVIDCVIDHKEIIKKLKKIMLKKETLNFKNPYEKKNVTKNILRVLEKINSSFLIKKKFYKI